MSVQMCRCRYSNAVASVNVCRCNFVSANVSAQLHRGRKEQSGPGASIGYIESVYQSRTKYTGTYSRPAKSTTEYFVMYKHPGKDAALSEGTKLERPVNNAYWRL